jgi:hypothetical protein
VPAGGPSEPALCRICWEGEEPGDEGRLVAPCACSGSMVSLGGGSHMRGATLALLAAPVP